ncbi:MAG: hypothetical protein ACFCUH_13420 [Flavobacteriales bacterium]
MIVFVAVDEQGKPQPVKPFIPSTDEEKHLERYALALKELRATIENEMKPFLT